MDTKEKIVRRALEMFNENGIEYVGVREIAKDLGLSPGNVSYYFPKKENLVLELMGRLKASNSEFFGRDEIQTMDAFLLNVRMIFENQWKFRSLYYSWNHIITRFESTLENYKPVEDARFRELGRMFRMLEDAGSIQVSGEDERNYLLRIYSMISRFWIQESRVSLAGKPVSSVMEHYLQLICTLLKPYLTDKGNQEIRLFWSDAKQGSVITE